MSRPVSHLAHAGRLLAGLALAAACTESPVGPRGYAATPDRSTVVQLYAGDSLDLASLASARFGMLHVANCASTDPEVASVLDANSLQALAEGSAMIRCSGAIDRRVDSAILTGEELPTDGAEEYLRWVTFDVELTVLRLDASPTDAAERNGH